jgi:hypothetical protein
MNTNIIKRIDEVIKELMIIREDLTALDYTLIKEAVKEAVEEVIEGVVPSVVSEEAPVEVKKVDKKAKVVESEVEEEIEDEVEEDTVEEAVGFDREAKRAELEAMKYNDLKALAVTIEGASAVGKKVDIIESILNAYEAIGGVPSEEETTKGEEQEIQGEAEESKDVADKQEDEEADSGDDDENREEFVEFLESLETDEIKEIAEQAGIKVGKKVVKAKLIEELVEDLDKLVEALEALGYYDEEDEEDTVEASEEVIEQEEEEEEEDETVASTEEETGDEEDERIKIVEEYGLEEYTVEELADICAEYELSTKGKKQALIDRIVKGIMDGTIELEDEPEKETQEEEKAPLKKVAEYDNPQRAKKEAEVEADIRDKYEKGKLKDNEIKKFLDKYNEGDPECAGCKGCSKEDMLECYIDIHKALVDDDGDLNEFEEPYIRDGEYFCCGREIKELENGNLYCQVCGTEYEE